jgi:hypothetical protein
MIKFRRHYPSFFTGGYEGEIEVASLEELLEVEWIKNFSKYTGKSKFYRYSISGKSLMAEYNKGETWWVIGYTNTELSLPKWDRSIVERQLKEQRLKDHKEGVEYRKKHNIPLNISGEYIGKWPDEMFTEKDDVK